ncbi:MAG: hypothetical protein QGI83_10500 [Candidatus Latescibacteria bacterium]|nr:hypothetical protein [Candidatus Latescibacterota bacterium]
MDISIKSFAVPGYRDVTVTNPDTQSDTLVNGFTVAPAPDPPPTVTSCVPDNGLPNQSFVVSVYGSDFVATPTADFGSRIDILVVTFVSSTQIDVTIDIRHNATVGYRDVMITNPDTRS